MRGQIAANCSMAITASISVPPYPPSLSSSAMPINPCLAKHLAVCGRAGGRCRERRRQRRYVDRGAWPKDEGRGFLITPRHCGVVYH